MSGTFGSRAFEGSWVQYLAADGVFQPVLLVVKLLNSVAHMLLLLLHVLRHNYVFVCTQGAHDRTRVVHHQQGRYLWERAQRGTRIKLQKESEST